jgi:hypothetical protein
MAAASAGTFKPLEREGRIERWDDTRIRPGEQWRAEIEAGLAKAQIAVLLISADFVASDFIAQHELPPLLDAAEQQNTTILCVLLSPSGYQRIPELARYQAVNSPDETVIDMTKADQERVFDRVAELIEEKLV